MNTLGSRDETIPRNQTGAGSYVFCPNGHAAIIMNRKDYEIWKRCMPSPLASVVLDEEGKVLVGSIATVDTTAADQSVSTNSAKSSKQPDTKDGFLSYKKQKESSLWELNPNLTQREVSRILEVLWENEPEDIQRIYHSTAGNRKGQEKPSKKSKSGHHLAEKRQAEGTFQPVRNTVQAETVLPNNHYKRTNDPLTTGEVASVQQGPNNPNVLFTVPGFNPTFYPSVIQTHDPNRTRIANGTFAEPTFTNLHPLQNQSFMNVGSFGVPAEPNQRQINANSFQMDPNPYMDIDQSSNITGWVPNGSSTWSSDPRLNLPTNYLDQSTGMLLNVQRTDSGVPQDPIYILPRNLGA